MQCMERTFAQHQREERNGTSLRIDGILGDEISPELAGRILAEPVPNIDALLQDTNILQPSYRFFTNNHGVVEYIPAEIHTAQGVMKLLHELGHRFFQHTGTVSDTDNLQNEKIAWRYAIALAKRMGIELSDEVQEMIARSIETYKQHIDQRSICTSCGSINTQEYAPQCYTCRDCFNDW